MATQSLYRRYRPRRFSEVRGQDHVVKALRTAVAEGREGQAYLFSGPRGTGKTTSARILAKVLNCTNAIDGEPCCECESCLSVERGTSYDVHELDAASNNGVDSMRDLIDKASLGTPGRHKVYILDEVHMLTKPAEAALLKTLEEPPSHVVFVLATTDPQKMSDTIRSRTQHLQFHLLPADTLQEHVRWVAEDAGLTVSDAAFEQVLAQGGGSARDTLSALELVANTGGEGAEIIPVGDFVEAMIEHDPGRALTTAASSIGLGRDPRTLTEELIAYLRNGFLSIMAPELVQLPSARVAELSEQAQRLGAAGLVRGIEQLGAALTEMRHAPDPRVLLDVAIVKLTSDASVSGDTAGALAALVSRVAKLEKQVAEGVVAPAGGSQAPTPTDGGQTASSAPVPEAPRDPSTGRATLGGRARKAAPPATAPAAESPAASSAAPDAAPVERPGAEPSNPVAEPSSPVAEPAAASPAPTAPQPAASAPGPAPAPAPAPAAAPAPAPVAAATISQAVWDDTVKPGLRGMARAVFSPATYVAHTDTALTLALPNPVHREKCEQHRAAVEDALAAVAGAPVALELVLAGGGGQDGGRGGGAGSGGPSANGPKGDGVAAGVTPSRGGNAPESASGPGRAEPAEPMDPEHPAADPRADVVASDESRSAEQHASTANAAVDDAQQSSTAQPSSAPPKESPRRAAERKAAEAAANGIQLGDDAEPVLPEADVAALPEDHEVDLNELVDAPPESVKTPIDRLAEAFPGSELVTETY